MSSEAEWAEVHASVCGTRCTWCTDGRKQAPAYGVRGGDGRGGRRRWGHTSTHEQVFPT